MFDLTELRTAVKGRVLLKGDDDFEIARRPYNLAVSQPVDAVVEVSDVRDVTAVVRYAGERGLSVTVQPSGHGATGDVGSDGVILLRTSHLDQVDIDPDRAPHASALGCGGGKRKQPQRHSASPDFPAVHRRSAWRATHSAAV